MKKTNKHQLNYQLTYKNTYFKLKFYIINISSYKQIKVILKESQKAGTLI